MKINRLRLSGFKSFVEPTEFHIEPGLTGIVGPNGCGKSNLLEALRWAMGENSPKSMRGEGMEDVIFAGTSNRPMRNMAEVVIGLDNTARDAPAAYNGDDHIEVSRRIEREMGSVYRINGREVRQRDVHIFFADASTGAHSPSLVRQGQIGQIINAKPIARRAMLEEAAGISGLHSRRHEAEIRLRAADANLLRLNDVLRELETQLQSLKKQARQASRYKNISGHIRKAEAIGHHLRWTSAAKQVEEAEAELKKQQAATAEATGHASAASTAQANAQSALPDLRLREAERAAALQRLRIERETLDAEEKRAKDDAGRLEARIIQTMHDIERERALAADARAVIAKIGIELAELGRVEAQTGSRERDVSVARDAAQATLADAERALDSLSAEAATLSQRRNALADAAAQAHERAERTAADLKKTEAELAALKSQPLPRDDDSRAALAAKSAREARAAYEKADAARALAELEERKAREAYEPVAREAERLKTEAATLARLLRSDRHDLFPPLIDALKVTGGYEAALGAALGDDLVAPLDEAAPIHWKDLGPHGPNQSLPDGVKPLSELVAAPRALQRRLSQTGLVASPAEAKKLQAKLLPGQRLVTRDGGLWRWDGYSAAADAKTPAALRLENRNRLAELDGEIKRAETAAARARKTLDDAHAALSSALAREAQARDGVRKADEEVAAAHGELSQADRALAERALAAGAAEEAVRRLKAQLADALAAKETASRALSSLPDDKILNAAVAERRETVEALRKGAGEARAIFETWRREAEQAARRRDSLNADLESWRARDSASHNQIGELEARRAADKAERERLLKIPGSIAERRASILDAIGIAEQNRKQAADALAEGENALAAADRRAKETQSVLSEAREARARAEAVLDAARTRLSEMAARIREAMQCEPTKLLELAEWKTKDEMPSLLQVEEKIERLKRERDTLGGVNLRAEEEAQECETRFTSLTAEKNDLEAAIAKLRSGIASLNREGRERLLAAFETVNGHFKKLFSSLFGGGEAQLTLVESDDPLEAGLEIFARPPGKRLQIMSLLSGGEQALTALALIFAVFLSNPAPICVLDEVDAPLDDANVERFCNLLDEMTKLTDTRFLIITHHALTMSRMNRLFGVTMAERGVSQIVSVDLAQAERVLAAE